MSISKHCLRCGKEFKVKPSLADKAKFCSKKCNGEATRKDVIMTCAYCGKERRVTPYKKKIRKFCSKECGDKAKERVVIGKCQYCDREMMLKPYMVNKRKFCSRECKIKAMVGKIGYWRDKKRPDIVGENNPMYGKPAWNKGMKGVYHWTLSDEIKRNMSISKIGIKFTEEHCRKIIKSHIGKKLTEEHKQKIGDGVRGKKRTELTKKKMGIASKQRWKSREYREKIHRSRQGFRLSQESKEKIGKKSKERWQKPEFIKKVFKARAMKPNKSEIKIEELLNEISPNEWKYNGDFSQGITIGGRIPDFVNVNGKKMVIELFGEYFHAPLRNPRVRFDRTHDITIKHYKKFGYGCLIIWDSELNNLVKVKEKLLRFYDNH